MRDELNGGDFLSMPRMALRDRILYVAQRPFIFPGTVADNIRVGNSAASDADVQRAGEMAGIFSMGKTKPILGPADATGKKSLVDRTVMKIQVKPWEQNRLKSVAMAAGSWMYNKWMRLHEFEQDTVEDDAAAIEAVAKPPLVPASAAFSASAVPSPPASTLHPTLLLETAERGTNLSGGFAQSVALARVFLRTQAQIVILDEPIGQMDALKKREVIFPTLFRFVKKHCMTLILISYVAQVCKLVDHVYVLASGQLVPCGADGGDGRRVCAVSGGAGVSGHVLCVCLWGLCALLQALTSRPSLLVMSAAAALSTAALSPSSFLLAADKTVVDLGALFGSAKFCLEALALGDTLNNDLPITAQHLVQNRLSLPALKLLQRTVQALGAICCWLADDFQMFRTLFLYVGDFNRLHASPMLEELLAEWKQGLLGLEHVTRVTR